MAVLLSLTTSFQSPEIKSINFLQKQPFSSCAPLNRKKNHSRTLSPLLNFKGKIRHFVENPSFNLKLVNIWGKVTNIEYGNIDFEKFIIELLTSTALVTKSVTVLGTGIGN